MGTNAFPFLMRWIRTKEPGYHYFLSDIAGKLPYRLRPRWAGRDYIPRALLSAHAFKVLGSQAGPVVPELSLLAADPKDPEAADMSLAALSYMGSNGVPALLAAVANRSHPYRTHAAYQLGLCKDLGPNRDAVITELIAELKDPAVNESAADALGALKTRPDIVVPALAQCLEQTNTDPNLRAIAAISLIWFDEKGEPGLPYLTNALNDPDPEVRKQAANSIQQIQSSMRQAQRK
jgi:HEAT repeat protein